MDLRVRWHKLTWRVVVILVTVALIFLLAEPRLWSTFFTSGIILVGIGELVRIWAAGHLTKNKSLTTTGPYAYCKNPLYIGTFLISVGICLMAETRNYLNFAILGCFILFFLVYYTRRKKDVESKRLLEIFGDKWERYDKQVPDYFPRLVPYKDESRQWSIRSALENSEHWTALAVIFITLAICFKNHIIFR